MKQYSLPLLLFLLFTACMREDLSDCPPQENLILRFSYPVEGTERFKEIASSVDMFLFDEEGMSVRWERIEKAQLITTDSVVLSVEEGLYHLIVWVNSGENTYPEGIKGETKLADWLLSYTPLSIGEPLYYGKEPLLEITGNDPVSYTIEVTPSYKTVHLYIEGLQDIYAGENLLPLVRISGVPGGYDFLGTLQKETLTLQSYSEPVLVNNKEMAYSRFFLPLFEAENDMRIDVIKNSDNTVAGLFRLQDYIEENDLENELEINIHIGFFNSGIEITLPGWNSSGDVTPEF